MRFRMDRSLRLTIAVLLSTLVHLAGAEGRTSSCVVRSIGIDTSHANLRDGVFNGRAWSQVFLAEDTLIASITVWRPITSGGLLTPVRVFILEVIPYGYGPDTLVGPDPSRILLEGPQSSVPFSPDHPVPVRFDLDPPFALPRQGTFAFAVKDDDLYCSGIYGFLFDSLNTYPYGNAWKISPNDYCGLGLGVFPYPERDFIFQIEFCEEAVPVRSRTWGALKAIYR